MLARDQYRRTVVRPYAPFLVSLICHGSAEPSYFQEVLDEPVSIQDLLCVNGLWYYSEPDLQSITEATSKWLTQPEYLERAKQLFGQWSEALLAASYSDFSTYCTAYEHYMPTLQCIWQVEDPVEQSVRDGLTGKLTAEEAEELMHVLNIPLEDNYHKKEEYDLVTTDNLTEHVKSYEWLYSRYGQIKPYTVEQAEKRLQEINKAAYLEKWDKDKKKLHATISRVKDLLGVKAHLVDVMQFIIFYRTQRTDVMNRSTYQAHPMLQAEAAKRDLTYEQLIHCTKEEILSQVPDTDTLNARIASPLTVMESGKVYCATGKKQEEILRFLEESVEQTTTFSGSIACRGLAQGTVRIIRSHDDFAKIQPGDILVTPMTTPVMIPIMKQAAAFVTDEGGITCHAAIISREMNKPCIIGTKIATRTLKDGDAVEVDANRGIITIL